MTDDSILNAATVADFMEAINERYELSLPTTFEAGTTFADVWQMAIEVTQDPNPDSLFQATTAVTYDFAPSFAGKVVINVLKTEAE